MRLLRWLRGDSGNGRKRRATPRESREGEEPKGDFRGSYGFGRRAYRPDPQAHYGFDSDARRSREPDSS